MTRPAVFLCADDYALTDGVSGGIEALAEAGRLSGTSALVTTRHWLEHGKRVSALSGRIAVGLHLNFTLGSPLGSMPRHCRKGRFPAIGTLVRRSLLGWVDPAEFRIETLRQIDRFTEVAGQPPEFIDGHQHAHALPGVRQGVLDAIRIAFPAGGLLVRDPADRVGRIVRRRAAVAKSLLLAGLSRGFGAAARASGFITNDGFAGVSPFDRRVSYAQEFAAFLSEPGPLHLVMCHPGVPDGELAALDPVVDRRKDELDTLMTLPDLPNMIWRKAAAGNRSWQASEALPA